MTAAALLEQRLERTFAELKEIDDPAELDARRIPVADRGWLVPICTLNAADPELARLLTDARNRWMHLFPTQFEATVNGTRRWIRTGLLGVPDRILFLIVDLEGNPVGHIGYARTYARAGELKLDNMLRFTDDAPRGLMSAAIQAVLRWGWETLRPRLIVAPAAADNDYARKFFARLGFYEEDLVPLRRHDLPGGRIEYRELEPGDTASPDRHLLRLVYKPD